MSRQRTLRRWACAGACVAVTATAAASVTVYSRNLAGFNTAAGNPPIVMTFDDLGPGTDITGTTMNGVQFLGPGAPLIVVRGADTYTPSGFSGAPNPASNTLPPTSGANVLSPGGVVLGPGPNTPIENDDLTLVFVQPVRAFGFDHLSQSADGAGFSYISVYNASSVLLYSGWIPISTLGGGGAPAGADFWGIVSTAEDIKRIVIDEQDNNSQYPDCNIGYDTLRYTPAPLTCMIGDMNGDSQLDGADLQGFVTVLFDPAAATEVDRCRADTDKNGSVETADVSGFVALLISAT